MQEKQQENIKTVEQGNTNIEKAEKTFQHKNGETWIGLSQLVSHQSTFKGKAWGAGATEQWKVIPQPVQRSNYVDNYINTTQAPTPCWAAEALSSQRQLSRNRSPDAYWKTRKNWSHAGSLRKPGETSIHLASEKQKQLSLSFPSRRSAKPRTTGPLLYFSDQ